MPPDCCLRKEPPKKAALRMQKKIDKQRNTITALINVIRDLTDRDSGLTEALVERYIQDLDDRVEFWAAFQDLSRVEYTEQLTRLSKEPESFASIVETMGNLAEELVWVTSQLREATDNAVNPGFKATTKPKG